MSAEQAATTEYPIDDRRELVGWYFYDWANSTFSTTVVTVFLGPYLTSIARAAADADGMIYPLGIPVAAGSYFAYIVSLSVLLQVFFLPILGAIADYSRAKKLLLGIFAYIGAFATMGMFFLQGERYILGGSLFLIANLAFGASIVFYNAFLPEIASPDNRDRASSRGWAMGYLGGGVLLFLNLILFTNAEALGLDEGTAVRICITSAGLWWAIFTIMPLIRLRTRGTIKRLPPGERYVTIGFKQLAHTFSQMQHYRQTLLFLLGYLLYNDGIQAVIALAALFGAEELGMPQGVIIQAILMVQFVAFFGALAFGRLAQRIGSKRAIMLSLVIWTVVVTYSYVMPAGVPAQFFLLAAAIAVVLGGSQALSRSLFSLMIPKGQEAEYFSIYEISERGTSWLAPLLFGLAFQMTGSYRIALISLIVFFIAGIVLLFFVNVRRAIEEVGNEAPALV
ncbi:MFS transporter [Candidatus Chloroploca sp. Khr17]|uniref:MFS transporter n=1 Tax=Candidatus Chloroploca sp. Khr17 TaxID=2496869 RepID=UPI00101D9A57|nr:MFS transporter [Candidatus Chloroploca sp. Khr17]